MGCLRMSGLLILLLLASPAFAQNQALLVDKSGSMHPYYRQGFVKELGEKILRVLQTQGRAQIVAFSTTQEEVPTFDAISIGGDTLLDKAIQYVIQKRYAIAWLITDNIQHGPGDQQAGNTIDFYKELRGSSIRKVVVFPMLQSAGTPGIAVYAVLISPDSVALFDKEIAEFLNVSSKSNYKTEALQMKPLDINTVDIKIEKSSLDPKKSKPYEEGQSVHESFDIRFKSKFNHLRIATAKIEVPNLEADFGPESVLEHGKPSVIITPTTVKSLDPQAETDEVYKVDADLATVKLKKDFLSLWKAAFGKSKESHVLTLKFLINVPRESFQLKDQFLNNYNATTLESAKETGKIYGIESLPSLMTEEMTPITSEIKIPVQVKYPWWPSVLFILLSLILMALVVGGIWFGVKSARGLIGHKRWKARATTEYGSSLVCETTNDNQVLVQSVPVGEITGNKFRPEDGIGIIDAQDGKETVSLSDGLCVRLKLSRGEIYLLTFEVAESDQEEGGDTYTPGRR